MTLYLFTSRFFVYSIPDGIAGHKYYVAEESLRSYGIRKNHSWRKNTNNRASGSSTRYRSP